MHALTVDVEEYFQVSACEGVVPRFRWPEIPSRLDVGLDRLLDLCERYQIRGTFFVLGWTATHRPDVIRRIVEHGHELGCHSYDHRLVYRLSPKEFASDLDTALEAIEHAAGVRVTQYRAPSFSITPRSLWALDILGERGIRTDSSIYPVAHDRYGFRGAPRFPYRPAPNYPDLIEVPPSTVRLGPLTLPCAGGGYLRLLPWSLTLWAMRRIEREGHGGVIYVHPWELDPRQPRLAMSRARTWRHRVGLRRVERRLERLLERLSLGSLSDLLAEAADEPGSFPLRNPPQAGAVEGARAPSASGG